MADLPWDLEPGLSPEGGETLQQLLSAEHPGTGAGYPAGAAGVPQPVLERQLEPGAHDREWLSVLTVGLPGGATVHPATFDRVERVLANRYPLTERWPDRVRIVYGVRGGDTVPEKVSDCMTVAHGLLALLGLPGQAVTEHRLGPAPTPLGPSPVQARHLKAVPDLPAAMRGFDPLLGS